MNVSIFFARFLGIYLLIIGVLWLIRRNSVKAEVKDIFRSVGMIFLEGEIALILGIFIAIVHSMWVSDWRIIVTILGYLMIIKGVVRIGWPERSRKALSHWLVRPAGYTISLIVCLILGIVLTYFGFSGSTIS
jgi:hypothetical protein